MSKVMTLNALNYCEQVYKKEKESVPEVEKLLDKYLQVRDVVPEEYVHCIGCPTTRRNFELETNVCIDKRCFNDEQDSCCYEPSACMNAADAIREIAGGRYYHLLQLAKEVEKLYESLE